MTSSTATRGAFIWLVVILAVFGSLKVIVALHTRTFGADAGMYTDVAMNLRDGFGLSATTSEFNHGYRHFPHPTSVYPLWPFVLAAGLHLLPPLAAGAWLPPMFAMAALVAAYFVGRRLAPARVLPPPLPPLDGGHALVVMLGGNLAFFHSTSQPYTEAFGFALLFAFLLRARTLLVRASLRDGVELGAWLAALFYTRSHFLIVPMAVAIAIAAELALSVPLSIRERRAGDNVRRLARLGLVAGVVAVALFLPFWIYLGSFLENPGLGTYFRFDQARPSESANLPLTRYVLEPRAGGVLVQLGDRLRGAALSLWPPWPDSYFQTYRLFALSPIVAALALVVRPRALPAIVRDLASGSPRVWNAFLFALTLGGLASVHLVHKTVGVQWYFAERYGLICFFFFFFCLLFALRSGTRLATWVVAALIVAGGIDCVLAQAKSAEAIVSKSRKPLPIGWSTAVVDWLEQKQREEGTVIVALSQPLPRRMAWRLSPAARSHVGIHWLWEASTVEDLLIMTDQLGVKYVLLPRDNLRERLTSRQLFKDHFVAVDTIGSGKGAIVVYQRS